jgi:thiol-disulfide isomerase/thioredoxin
MRLRSLILGVSACLPLACFGAQDVQARFEKSLKDAKSISNIEIHWLDTLWINDTEGLKALNAEVFSRTFQYSFIASGLKFRARCKLISGTQTNLAKLSESAFDGESYATYSGDTRYMTKSSEDRPGANSESAHNPLTAPFMFLTKQSDDCMGCVLRSTGIASGEFAQGLTLPIAQKSAGLLEISMPGLRLGKQPTIWKIVIDEAGDSFTPKMITMVAPGGRIEVVNKFLNYTNLGAYQFPSRIESTMTSYPPTTPPTVLSTGTVTVISARITDQTADSVFRLDSEEKSAAVVWDWDVKNFTKSVHADSSLNPSTQARPNIYDESADGSKQIGDALAIARKEHKHVLIQFGANWCGWCHKLHKLFETDKSVAEELERQYVVVMIDVNKGHNSDIDTKYGHPTRFGLPAIVVLDADGKQLTTQDTGKLDEADHHSPQKVVAFLKEWSPKK